MTKHQPIASLVPAGKAFAAPGPSTPVIETQRHDGWTPERGFQDPGMNSFAHYAFGAVTQWMFEHVGGLRH